MKSNLSVKGTWRWSYTWFKVLLTLGLFGEKWPPILYPESSARIHRLFELCGKAIPSLSYLQCVLKVYESDFSGCPKIEGAWVVPLSYDFFQKPLPSSNQCSPPLKSEAPFQILIPKKTLKNSQERDFLTWSI